MGAHLVVQQGLRTPTGPFSESCFILGIRGSGCGWRFLRRSARLTALFSGGTLNGVEADRWLEVPAWMFDRATCADRSQLSTSPFVSLDALSALSDLLKQALKPPPSSSSNAPHSGASRSSRDQNSVRGHDHADDGASATRRRPASKAAARQRSTSSDRPVRRSVTDGARGSGSRSDHVIVGVAWRDAPRTQCGAPEIARGSTCAAARRSSYPETPRRLPFESASFWRR